MKELFQEESNYEYIHHKLISLIELRDTLIEKMISKNSETEKILAEFQMLTEFEQ